MATSIDDLHASADQITKEAVRVLNLSASVFNGLPSSDQRTVIVKVDAEAAQNDILLRLLGLSKPKQLTRT